MTVILTIFALFGHANIHLSPKVWGYVERIIITPYLHRVHHSNERTEHDTNCGVIFIFGDRMFSTLHTVVSHRIGLAKVEEKNILSFLSFPFKK
jgi:sterol desaturase/sphingolipid hydroxylase (fatty acid hydroxylase superfamily)